LFHLTFGRRSLSLWKTIDLIAIEKGEDMLDTREDREIKQQIDAKEAQIEAASKKLFQKSKTATRAKMNWASREGAASPLGVTWISEEEAYNFALYSKHASGVTLLLFSREDVTHPIYEYAFNPLINKSGLCGTAG
jgi:Carbohydrate-binding module 48 (Isoamylase N-terminal domain)